MKISEIESIKVCDIVLNECDNDKKQLWNINWVNLGSLLTQNNGRCYFIVVNDEIFKIGYSDQKGGIKATISSYMSCGNSGSPSDRTHGIHILIAEQLLMGNKVEVYFSYNHDFDFTIRLMNGEEKIVKQSLSGKILEIENVRIFREKEGKFPIWNLQESGACWPKHIIDSRIDLLQRKQSVTLESIKKRVII